MAYTDESRSRLDRGLRPNRQGAEESTTGPRGPWQPRSDHHYTVHELADEWNLSTDYIRRMFGNEAGVLVFSKRQPGKRVYRVIRIPPAVAERVYRRSQIVG